jgi:hypothetical protein
VKTHCWNGLSPFGHTPVQPRRSSPRGLLTRGRDRGAELHGSRRWRRPKFRQAGGVLGSGTGARGAALHGELDLSDGGGGDLPEAPGRDSTWSAEGLDDGCPWGGGRRRGTGRRGGRLSGGPRGVSWLTGEGLELAVCGSSAMASTVAAKGGGERRCSTGGGGGGGGVSPFFHRWRRLEMG